MKRFLSLMLVFLMLLSALPAFASPIVVEYSKSDVMAALSSMGRMPSDYYNMAGMLITAGIGDITPAQSEKATKKLYSLWGFLSTYAYEFDENVGIKDIMTKEQWTQVTSYISDLAYTYGKPELFNIMLQYLSVVTTNALNKVAVPMGLLGVKFDAATLGASSTVKIYTTTAIQGSDIVIKDAAGNVMNAAITTNTIAGTLSTYYEHLVSLKPFTVAGKQNVRVYVGNAALKNSYVTASITVTGSTDTGSAQKNAATVKKVSSTKVDLGLPSTISVETSTATTHVKITSKTGEVLVIATAPSSQTSTAKKFTLQYSFPGAGANSIRAYAGTLDGNNNVVWNTAYKTATVTVNKAASYATISKVATTNALRGQQATISVFASTSTDRVMLTNSSGGVYDYTDQYTISGKYRLFQLNFSSKVAGTYKLYVSVGDGVAWNATRRTVSVSIYSPSVTTIAATKVPRGTASTITVTASATAGEARLLDSKKQVIATVDKGGDGKFVFTWMQSSKGSKTIYVQVREGDGYDWGTAKKGTVTFT